MTTTGTGPFLCNISRKSRPILSCAEFSLLVAWLSNCQLLVEVVFRREVPGFGKGGEILGPGALHQGEEGGQGRGRYGLLKSLCSRKPIFRRYRQPFICFATCNFHNFYRSVIAALQHLCTCKQMVLGKNLMTDVGTCTVLLNHLDETVIAIYSKCR